MTSQTKASGTDAASIASWMTSYVSAVLNLPPDAFSPSDQFDAYGLDSVEAVIMAGVMEEEYSVVIEPTELLDHPSIDQFSLVLAARLASG